MSSGEGATFATRAGRLAGWAGAAIGWRPDEFWRATPAELRAIAEALLPEAPAPVDLHRLMEMFPDG